MSGKGKAFSNYFGVMICNCVGSSAYAGVAMFIMPVCEKLGTSVTAFSLVFTAIAFGLMVGGLVVGPLYAKLGAKRTALLTALSLVLFYATLGLSTSVVLIYAAGFLYGVCFPMFAQVLAQATITSWFRSGSGVLFSINYAVVTLAAMAVPLAISRVVVASGVTTAALAFGAGLTALAIAALLFLVTSPPDQLGIEPVDFGKKAGTEQVDSVEDASAQPALEDVPPMKALMTPMCLLIMLCAFALNTGHQMYYSNSTVIYQSLGIEYEQAAFYVSINTFVGFAVGLAIGALTDKIGPAKTISLFCILEAICFVVAFFLVGPTAAIVIAVLAAAGNVANYVAVFTIPRLYGPTTSATLLGWATSVIGVAAMVGPPIAASVYDTFGSFNVVFILIAAIFVVGAVIVTVALRKADRAAA